MVCESCNGPLGASRDPICLACAAVNTVEDELKAEWPNGSVKALATDLLVSCARHVRALRVTTLRSYAEAEDKGKIEERARQREAAQAKETAACELKRVRERSRTPAGVVAKAKPGPPSSRTSERGRTPRSEASARAAEVKQELREREALPRKPAAERTHSRRRRHSTEAETTSTRRRRAREDDEQTIHLHQRHLVLQDERETQSQKASSKKKWSRHP